MNMNAFWFNRSKSTPIPLHTVVVVPNQSIPSTEVLEDDVQNEVRRMMIVWGGDRWAEKGRETQEWRVEIFRGDDLLGSIPLSKKP